jgi:hypothetical protein
VFLFENFRRASRTEKIRHRVTRNLDHPAHDAAGIADLAEAFLDLHEYFLREVIRVGRTSHSRSNETTNRRAKFADFTD